MSNWVDFEAIASQFEEYRKWAGRSVFLAACYLVLFLSAEEISSHFERVPNLPVWYLPAGLAMTLLLVYGLGFLPVVLGAQVLADLLTGPGPMQGGAIHLLVSFLIVAVYGLSAGLIRLKLEQRGGLLRDPRSFGPFLLGVLLTSLLLASLNVLELAWTGRVSENGLGAAFLEALLGNAVGIVSLAPFLILVVIPWIEPFLGRLDGGRRLPNWQAAWSRISGTAFRQVLIHLGLTVAILATIFLAPGQNLFLRLGVLALPLVWVALSSGLQGVAGTTLGLTVGAIAVLWLTGTSAINIVEFQGLIVAGSLNGMLVGAFVTEGRLTHDTDSYRDAVLSSVVFAAEQLVGAEDWKKGLNEVLRRLGKAASSCHVYVLETKQADAGPALEPTGLEWTSSSVFLGSDQPNLLSYLTCRRLTPEMSRLRDGEEFIWEVRTLPEEERNVAAAFGIRSGLVVPIFVEKRLWGCLGLDRSVREYAWLDSEVETLKAAARSLGQLLARARTEEQYRQLTGNIRAVFWTSSSDGRRRTFVSASYEQIWGQGRASLRQRPDSWMDVIHSGDIDRVEAALSRSGDYEQEYRIILPDRSIRWIRDRGFPVRSETGQVSQMVGIAEDITEHKEVEERVQGTSLLLATLIDNLASGILVEDDNHTIRHVNQAFCETFDIPVEKDRLVGMDSRLLFVKSQAFADRVEQIRQGGVPLPAEELHFDGKILKRDYVPLVFVGHERFHLWQYQNITDEKNVEQQIKSSLSEKEVLLQEIHHRVKNNLQVICSLLNLQSNQIRDKKIQAALSESQNRVKAMALVHERLYKSKDLARIDFTDYVRSLVDHLTRTYKTSGRPISIAVEVDPVPLSIDSAIPCALIINELVSNSLKYAFPNDRKGKVLIGLRQAEGDLLSLSVRDNGVGMPEGFDLQTAESLGLKLVHGLTGQLGGTVNFRNHDGSEFEIKFSPTRNQSRREQKV